MLLLTADAFEIEDTDGGNASTIDTLIFPLGRHPRWKLFEIIKKLPSLKELCVRVDLLGDLFEELPDLLNASQVTCLKIEYCYVAGRNYKWVEWKPLFEIILSYGKLEVIDCFLHGSQHLSDEEIDIWAAIIRTCPIKRWNVGLFDFTTPDQFSRIMNAVRDSTTLVSICIFVDATLNDVTREVLRRTITGHVSLRYIGYFRRDGDYDWIQGILKIAKSKTSRVLSWFMFFCSNEIGIFKLGHRDIIRQLKAYLEPKE